MEFWALWDFKGDALTEIMIPFYFFLTPMVNISILKLQMHYSSSLKYFVVNTVFPRGQCL